jgi:hypothetical protein
MGLSLSDYQPSVTVLPPNLRLRKEDCDLHPDHDFHSRYRGIVGSLGYLVNMTRPDLAFAYSELNKHVQFPDTLHMTTTDHFLRYLGGTYEKGILFSRGIKHSNLLWGWVDADWAGDTDTRRSHTGPISWKSRRQDSVTLSTLESEYMVAIEDDKDVVYIRVILQDFGFPQKGPTNLYEDNLATVVMSTNPVLRKYSRRIDIHRHYVRELVLLGLIKIIPLGTHDMVADALTKSLPAPALMRHREVMMGHQRFQPFYARSFHAC